MFTAVPNKVIRHKVVNSCCCMSVQVQDISQISFQKSFAAYLLTNMLSQSIPWYICLSVENNAFHVNEKQIIKNIESNLLNYFSKTETMHLSVSVHLIDEISILFLFY